MPLAKLKCHEQKTVYIIGIENSNFTATKF